MEGIILTLEDNRRLREINKYALEQAGYTVFSTGHLREARTLIQQGLTPDVVILDIALPDGDGRELGAEIYQKLDAHVIYLSANSQAETMIRLLENDADDYIAKPYRISELLARVDAAMRRRHRNSEQTLQLGHLELSMQDFQASYKGTDLSLTRMEFLLLHRLCSHVNWTVNRADLVSEIWHDDLASRDSALTTTLWRLRKKIKDLPITIEAVPNGYRLTHTKDL
jgi:DNA-binding response OmpR family regulator